MVSFVFRNQNPKSVTQRLENGSKKGGLKEQASFTKADLRRLLG